MVMPAILFVKIAIFFLLKTRIGFLIIFFVNGCHSVICALGMIFVEFVRIKRF